MEKDRDKFEVLFVCTGNSCRSPMAEGILKKMLKESKLDNFEVSSAGIATLDGVPASLFALEVSKARDVDLTRHRSRQLNKRMLRKAHLVLVMSREHLEYIGGMDKKTLKRAYLLKTFPQEHSARTGERLPISNEDGSPGVLYIRDPMGGSIDDYNQCFLEIETQIRRLFPDLISLASKENSKDLS